MPDCDRPISLVSVMAATGQTVAAVVHLWGLRGVSSSSEAGSHGYLAAEVSTARVLQSCWLSFSGCVGQQEGWHVCLVVSQR